jgi:curli biogenesis system outer membrane secretion channel CsgG
MKIIQVLFAIFISLIINSCYLISAPPNVLIKKDFDGNGIAVLGFSKFGSYLSSDIGKVAADKLTDALFLDGKFNVIDRSKVNEGQAELEIASSESLSADQIQKLGLRLKANYLVLGRIQCISSSDYIDTDSDKELYISIRIISVVNSEVIGMATYSITSNTEVTDELNNSMSKIVKKIVALK